jgi:hypothetical protein
MELSGCLNISVSALYIYSHLLATVDVLRHIMQVFVLQTVGKRCA